MISTPTIPFIVQPVPYRLPPAVQRNEPLLIADRPEEEFSVLLRSNPFQHRPLLRESFVLRVGAQRKAQDLADRNYFSHVTPEGVWPNALAIQAGWNLPYAPDANYIESLAAGYWTAEDAWRALTDSPGHRAHILGENDFYAAQDWFGVGHVFQEGTTYLNYWVIWIAQAGDMISGE